VVGIFENSYDITVLAGRRGGERYGKILEMVATFWPLGSRAGR
jgi:hypothetical protein